ncbi:hypothetical protein BC938DRAFT_478860, partial [Jimgerdemannia flammicorona]
CWDQSTQTGIIFEWSPLYERGLEIREKVLISDHSGLKASLNDLTGLYKNQGKFDKTETLDERARAIRMKIRYSRSLNNPAVLYKDQGRYNMEELLYK